MVNTPPKCAPEELRSPPKADKYKIRDDYEIKITEDMIRLAWKVGSWVEVFSNTKRKWYLGQVVKNFLDTEGEWLDILYYQRERNRQGMKKEVQRFCKDVRPINQSTWKNRIYLPPKMARAAENQKEIHRDVRKSVKTINACLERPIDRANIDHQIKECQKVIEELGQLHLEDRLRQKLKFLNGSALEEATKKARRHLDIIALKKAIAQYGAFSHPVLETRAKEKLKTLQTNRYHSMINSVLNPKDIPKDQKLKRD